MERAGRRAGLEVAAAAVVAALGFVTALQLRVGPTESVGAAPFLLLLLAITAGAVVGGVGVGLGMTAISAICAAVLLPPAYELAAAAADDHRDFLLFLVLGCVASALGGSRKRLLDIERAERARAERSARESGEKLEASQTARRELEENVLAKDVFIATLSHELRAPLSAILGWVQLLRRKADASSLARGLDVIERNARAQARMIEDLLDVSRMLAGKMSMEDAEVDLCEVARAATESALPMASEKGVRLAIDVPDHRITVRGDPLRLAQVVSNLVGNAIKFTHAGRGVRVRVHEDGQAMLEVEDEGEGIDADLLPSVFDRFRQGDATRRRSGLGLGLWITRNLVQLHGGSITAASEGPGRGTRVTVRLPARPPPGAPRTELAGTRVLLVGADGEVARALVAAGAVVQSGDGTGWFHPRVVVWDAAVRDVESADALRTAERDGAAAIALARTEEQRRAAQEAGIDRVLAAPCDADELVRAVAALAR